jgi:hypothetical protein
MKHWYIDCKEGYHRIESLNIGDQCSSSATAIDGDQRVKGVGKSYYVFDNGHRLFGGL